MSIYLSVELDDGSRYLGQASGSYEWDIERPFPAPHEPITDISLPPDGEPIIWPIEPEPRIVPKIVIDEIYSLTEALAVAIPTDSHPDVANVHVIARYLGLHTDQIRSVQFVPDRRGFCHWHDWRHRAGRFTVLVETDKGEFLGVVTGRVQRDGRLRVKEILALNPAHDEWRGYFGRRTLRNIARYLGVSPREIASIQVAVVDPYYKLPVLIPDDPEVMPLRWPPRQLAVVVTLVDGTRFLGTLQLAGSWRGRWEPVYRVRILREIEPSYPDPWMPILRPPYPEPIGPIILPEVHRGAEGQEKQ